MPDFKFLEYACADGLLTITLNRPPYNVLHIAMLEELSQALDRAEREESVRVVLITGKGNMAFSAGVDVKDHTPEKVERMFTSFHGVIQRLKDFPLPTIALLNGSALGGGCELAIACDMVVASEDVQIGQPEIRLGVFAPIAAILMPQRMSLPKVMELLLGGGLIGAREALYLGLVNKVYSRDNFAEQSRAFIGQFLSYSRVALILTKRAIRAAAGKPFPAAMHAVEHIYLNELMSSADVNEGLSAYLEKRKPVWSNR